MARTRSGRFGAAKPVLDPDHEPGQPELAPVGDGPIEIPVVPVESPPAVTSPPVEIPVPVPPGPPGLGGIVATLRPVDGLVPLWVPLGPPLPETRSGERRVLKVEVRLTHNQAGTLERLFNGLHNGHYERKNRQHVDLLPHCVQWLLDELEKTDATPIVSG